jgi:hypothetical protein
MPRLAEGTLESSYASARSEFELAAEDQGVVEHHLRLGDQCIRVHCAGARLADVLLAALAHRFESRPRTPPRSTIDIWERRGLDGAAIRFPWRETEIEPGGLVRRAAEPRFVAVHDTYCDAVTIVDRPERALLHRIADAEALPWWERAAPLRPALFWALTGGGPRLVHAGAVGDERGGVLLAGARRSGKTTVAVAAAAHGFGYLGDDSILLYGSGGLTAGAIYSTASVLTEAGAKEKTVLDMTGSLRASVDVRAVIVPKIGGGRTRLSAVEPSQALLAWAPTSALRLPYDQEEVVATLGNVVRSVPCFALHVGDDARDLTRAVDEALGR